MSDIVERLRNSVFFLTDKAKVQEAAAEITRLRAEVARLRMSEADLEAVEWAARAAKENWQDWTRAAMYDDRFGTHAAKHEAREATLRAIAERHRRDA